MAGTDFIEVRMTSAGVEFANGGQLALHTARREFVFEPGKPLRVLRAYEWSSILSATYTLKGEPIFEIVPDAASAPSATPAISASAEMAASQEKK
jgi:hypothetical protein